jgi:hypothetical protein
MEPEGSLPHSQEPATCPYPERDQSSPFLPIAIFEDGFSKTSVTIDQLTRCDIPQNPNIQTDVLLTNSSSNGNTKARQSTTHIL